MSLQILLLTFVNLVSRRFSIPFANVLHFQNVACGFAKLRLSDLHTVVVLSWLSIRELVAVRPMRLWKYGSRRIGAFIPKCALMVCSHRAQRGSSQSAEQRICSPTPQHPNPYSCRPESLTLIRRLPVVYVVYKYK